MIGCRVRTFVWVVCTNRAFTLTSVRGVPWTVTTAITQVDISITITEVASRTVETVVKVGHVHKSASRTVQWFSCKSK